MNHEIYQSPLNTRYASKEMSFLFSDQKKFSTFRKLWVALAETEMELGLPIAPEQVEAMRAHLEDIDFERAKEWEKITRHDVMAHVKTFGEVAPEAAGIIHLGATSCFVGDNTDLIIMGEALELLTGKLAVLLHQLGEFAMEHRSLPTLGFTHYQPAQLVTVGKRAALWAYDLVMDLEELEGLRENLKLRGAKGTTGTQASFLDLFDGDGEKVKELDRRIVKKMGYRESYAITSQTYSRKVDAQILSGLSHLAESIHKMTNDIRLLQNLKELEEPFEKGQIGSSAMAYKRNPMRSERMSSLAKFVMNLSQNGAMVHATQWFERTLDDSANKRLSVAEAFLAADALMDIAINVTQGMVVYPASIEQHVLRELPFMATENILMEAVKRGGDRQELHEKIRVHSQAAAKKVKEEGLANDLLERLAQDPAFDLNREDLDALLDGSLYIGLCPQQVEEFVTEILWPIAARYEGNLGYEVELNV